MVATVVKLFHLFAFMLYAFCIYYFKFHLDIPQRSASQRRFGRYKFLTHWNLALQTVVFFVCCVIDFLGVSSSSRLTRIRDHVILSISVPVCMFVTTFFWSLYYIDPNFMFPPVLSLYYPSWLNHMVHTVPLVLIVIEIWLYRHQQPSREAGVTSLMCFSAVYVLWMQYLGIVYNIWVYSVLEILSFGEYVLFIAFSGCVVHVFYIFGEKLNLTLWHRDVNSDRGQSPGGPDR
ncbi:androgen-induced gene 1 protein-like [Ornithodoros turicata]|uniref:androgen-induced gene 1 protein-like n=1 Tax=Ornithodoros turicata TaxID=34597 RepID=UPI003138E285